VIEEPNPEADKAHDILMGMRKSPLSVEAQKLAMWSKLLYAIQLLRYAEGFDDDDPILINARILVDNTLDEAKAIK